MPDIPVSPNVQLEDTTYVSGGVVESLAKRLQEAEFLFFVHEPRSTAAKALLTGLADAVEGWEQRTTARSARKREELERAVAVVVCGVLVAALRRGNMVFRSMREGEFDKAIVGYTVAKTAFEGLTALGFLNHYPGIRFALPDIDLRPSWSGYASRYEATAALIELAAAKGITRDTVKAQFGTHYPARAQKPEKLVTLKPFDENGGKAIHLARGDSTHKSIQADVRTANSILAAHSWSGCQPPQLSRAFRHDWTYGGRWSVAGEASIQRMPKEERLGIEIDGQPVCEVDARGSQLSIVAALAGVQQLPGDPYQIGPLAAFDRAVVKDAVTATLGTGKLRKAWPRGMERAEDMGQITAALVSAHPYVRDLPGLLGIPAKQVALRLQNLEADCLTRAMRALWALGVPVVPIHDGLLAPASDVQAVAAALREGYLTATGASIQTTVEYG